MREQILSKAGEMFLRLGYKSVTMDDIANQLAISKKTLYKYFNNKESLVKQSTSSIHASCANAINIIVAKGYSPIEENFKIKIMFREMFENLGGSPLFQLKKYYPQVYKNVIETETDIFFDCILKNIERGVKLGYYRDDFNIEVFVDFYMSMALNIHQRDVSKEELAYLEEQALIYHTRAIATAKGLKELEKQLNK